MSVQRIAIGLIVIFSFAISLFAYPQLPEQVPSHWNAAGEVDGYLPKFWGAFLMPFLLVFLFIIYFVIPKIDPLKKNISDFKKYYENFFVIISLFFLVLHSQALLWAMGTEINLNLTMPLLLGVLFFYIGILLEHSKRNWFVGIRTPWTLTSDVVWDKTHKLGGKLFKVSGIICLFGVLFQEYSIWFILTPILLSSLYLIVYSYLEYKKEIS